MCLIEREVELQTYLSLWMSLNVSCRMGIDIKLSSFQLATRWYARSLDCLLTSTQSQVLYTLKVTSK